jgi:hypothetical protein
MSRKRVLARLGIGLAWFVVQVVIVLACFALGGELGGFGYLVWPDYYAAPLALGFIVGLFVGIWLDYQIPGWLTRARLRRLRRTGISVQANVDQVHVQVAGRSPGLVTYTLFVSWSAPASDVEHEYERQFRFWSNAPRAFRRLAEQRTLPLVYSPEDPRHFVLDIPFTPMLADFIL